MSIEQHIDGLREERKRVRRELDELRKRSKQLDGQLEQLETAIAALNARPQSSGRSGRGGVTQQQVSAEMVSLLQEAPLPTEELKRRLGQQLKLRGKPLTGYSLRYKQALRQSQFVVTDDVVSLA